MNIIEIQDKGTDLFYFRTSNDFLYKVQYEFDDKWRVSQASYHSHREGRPIQRRIQRPRWKKLGYLSRRPTTGAVDLLESCAELASLIQPANH